MYLYVKFCHLTYRIMSLTERISADLITAMKAKDKVALEAIRAAKTAFTLARAEKGADSLTC